MPDLQLGSTELLEDATLELILRLQIEDLDAIARADKGKAREGHNTDSSLAVQQYKEELEAQINLLFDRRLTRVFAQAVVFDTAILAENQVSEALATITNLNDETRAESVISESTITSVNNNPLDDELLAKLNTLYISGAWSAGGDPSVNSYEEEEAAGPSVFNTNRSSHEETRRCICCHEDKVFFDVVRVPCRHEYCRDCLKELFQASINDEFLFPPKCCKEPILLDPVRIFINSDLAKTYEKKKVEYETPNRTYCFSPNCSAFMPTHTIKDGIAKCQECQCRTCTVCKQAEHFGPCIDQEGDRQVLQLAEELDWQSCAECWTLVELTVGCNHIRFVAA